MSVTVDNEIDRAARFGQALEDLVYNQAKEGRLVFRTENDDLLVSYWSMIFDYCKGIGCLLHHKFHSPAFALQRPLVEALVRAAHSPRRLGGGRGQDQEGLVQRELREGRRSDRQSPRLGFAVRGLPEDFAKSAPQPHPLGHGATAEEVGRRLAGLRLRRRGHIGPARDLLSRGLPHNYPYHQALPNGGADEGGRGGVAATRGI